jgi:hypothetical protein
MFAGMSKPRPKSRSLSCTAVDFVEVEFPQSITPRLVLQFTEGICGHHFRSPIDPTG